MAICCNWHFVDKAGGYLIFFVIRDKISTDIFSKHIDLKGR